MRLPQGSPPHLREHGCRDEGQDAVRGAVLHQALHRREPVAFQEALVVTHAHKLLPGGGKWAMRE